jgi:hypothetical protein
MNGVRRRFSDEVARAIARAGVFSAVDRSGRAGDATLIVDGVITDYTAGNVVADIPIVGTIVPTAREEHFTATVYLRDGASGNRLQTFEVDQNNRPEATDDGVTAPGDLTIGPVETIAARVLKDYGGAAGSAAVGR